MHGVALVLSHTVQKSGFVGEHVVQRASGVCWQYPGLMDMHSVMRHCEHEVPLTQCPAAQQRMLQTSFGFVQSTGPSTAATFTAWTDARMAQKRAVWGVMMLDRGESLWCPAPQNDERLPGGSPGGGYPSALA